MSGSDNAGAATANSGGASPASSQSSTGSSTSSSSAASSASPTKKIDYGMSPRTSTESTANNSSRLSGDQLFEQYGEEIFQHPRFKELTPYKKQYEAIDPIIKELGSAEELRDLHKFLGPVWQSLSALRRADPNKANSVWSKLVPVFTALTSGQEIDPFFAQQAAKVVANAEANMDDDDPVQKELSEVKKRLDEITKRDKDKELAQRDENNKRVATDNYQKYESLFSSLAKEAQIPTEAYPYLGEIFTNRIIQYMPKGTNGKPLNPLFSFNEQGAKDCFKKEILAAFSMMSKAGVRSAVTRVDSGGAAVANPAGRGGTVSGTVTPINRAAKSARMAQFFE